MERKREREREREREGGRKGQREQSILVSLGRKMLIESKSYSQYIW